jgi:hypothetical protein
MLDYIRANIQGGTYFFMVVTFTDYQSLQGILVHSVLNARVIEYLNTKVRWERTLRTSGSPQNLYPQCLSCSRSQGGQVREFLRKITMQQ